MNWAARGRKAPLSRRCGAGRSLQRLAPVYRFVLQLVLLALTAGGACAHDPVSYGGVFRSRNLGGTWLSADVGLFLDAALARPSIPSTRVSCSPAPISVCWARATPR